jgi:hypothetical protein
MKWPNSGNIRDVLTIAPREKSTAGVIICIAGVLVVDRDDKKFDETRNRSLIRALDDCRS